MQANPNSQSLSRSLLILGRISNLPTVWSNCIAGWFLAGGGELRRLGMVCLGSSLLYIGGMYLNDACDSGFDTLHRSVRPIPSGAIAARTVWVLSFVWLGLGSLVLISLGRPTALTTIALLGCIVVYDFVHKKTIFAPILMAGCRFLLYLVAAAAALGGIKTGMLWRAVALALYIIGLSYLARKESTQAKINGWSLVLLVAPMIAAAILSELSPKNVALSVLCLGWIAWCLRPIILKVEGAIGRTVSGLLAGIVLVDVLAVEGGAGLMPLIFLVLFGSALLLQRIIPAT